MELEEEHDDLSALRLLYGLLHDSSLELQYAKKSKDLFEQAQVLLKCMLDVIAEKVWETHLKFITAQTNVSYTDCSSQPEEPILRLQMKPPGLEASITQNPGRDSEFCRITSQNHEQPLSKLVPRKVVSELSMSSFCRRKERN